MIYCTTLVVALSFKKMIKIKVAEINIVMISASMLGQDGDVKMAQEDW